MFIEVRKATGFLIDLIEKRNCMDPLQLEMLRSALSMIMYSRYRDHWFPECPTRGSGYRCIRVNRTMDPVIAAAGNAIGVSRHFLQRHLPLELTMWIDPQEVSYRIGENGSICSVDDNVLSRALPAPPPAPCASAADLGRDSDNATPPSDTSSTVSLSPSPVFMLSDPPRFIHAFQPLPQYLTI